MIFCRYVAVFPFACQRKRTLMDSRGWSKACKSAAENGSHFFGTSPTDGSHPKATPNRPKLVASLPILIPSNNLVGPLLTVRLPEESGKTPGRLRKKFARLPEDLCPLWIVVISKRDGYKTQRFSFLFSFNLRAFAINIAVRRQGFLFFFHSICE